MKREQIGMQFKSFDIKDYDVASRKISGYAAVFNNVDKAKDKLIKGCFAKSIEERGPKSNANDKIILLWQHDQKEPIGRLTELYEDEKGLYFEAILDEIELGDRALKQLESGTLNQFSIGYSYVWENCHQDKEENCTIVKEVKLYEISIVSIGCNGMTRYLGLKSVEEYDNACAELASDIAEVTKHMSVRKQASIHNIIAKAMSLATFKPDVADDSLEVRADSSENENKKSMFDFKIKKV